MLSESTIKEFLERVRSGDPTPGGGSVAALGAALSAGLAGMVARLSLGRSDDAAVDRVMSALMARAGELEERLIADIDRDSLAYGEVIAAYRMPKGTEEEKAARRSAIQDAFAGAARVPLSVAEAGVELLSLAATVVREGNANAVTDGAVGAMMARSAVLGALYNVRANVSFLKDRTLAAEMADMAGTLEKKAVELEAEVLSLARSIMEKQA
jgi:methenyltetrahydrofolate cyclohydrolase